MNNRPRRELLTFDCPNPDEYCFLRKKIAGEHKCVVRKKSIHFTCRYIQKYESEKNEQTKSA